MSTADYIPPPMDLQFLPHPPPLHDSGPWVLEIGPGKGEFLLHLAQQEPRTRFAAIEIKKGRFERVAERAARLTLNNIFLVRGDARECLPRLFKPGSLERVYILFPDPWPKKRHAKHRLLKPRLIQILRDLLTDKGHVYSATDADFYGEQIVESFTEGGGFSVTEIDSLYPTYFESKWRKIGRKIRYWRFEKQNSDTN